MVKGADPNCIMRGLKNHFFVCVKFNRIVRTIIKFKIGIPIIFILPPAEIFWKNHFFVCVKFNRILRTKNKT